jgi:hypothetical protein
MAWAVALSLLVAACSPSTSVPLTEAPTKPPTDAPTEAPTEPPVTEPPATEPPAEPERALSGLPADPRRVDFQAEDGKNLVGYYYASKYADAPIMILMHWAGGDLTDWCEIALWLQNRRDENPVNPERCANAGSGLPAGTAARWLDPTWFPPMNANASIAVFAFDFRDYGESEAGLGSPSDWVKDAHAAFKTVAGFEGVNATRIASLGASIGADGAPDGCLLHNQEAGSGCVGAFSLSPGSYLDMNYAQVIADLASIPVWCLAAENDGASAPTCLSASGESYRSQVYAGSDAHGMMLLSPDFDPQPMVLIQEFVELVFGEKVK